MSTPAFYTNHRLLPQSQSPDQLSAWLSGKHPGYDLVAWCFYGNLISKNEDDDKSPKIDAIAYVTQFIQSPNMPQLEGIGIRPFQTGFTYNSAASGYLLSGDNSSTPTPAVTVTSNHGLLSRIIRSSQNSQQAVFLWLMGRWVLWEQRTVHAYCRCFMPHSTGKHKETLC